MFELISQTPVKKSYAGYGYEITIRKTFKDLPVTISIVGIGLNKLLRPSFTVHNKQLSIDYNSMSSVVINEGQDYFKWTKEVSEFIDAFFKEYDNLIKF